MADAAERLDDDDDAVTVLGEDTLGTPEARGDFLDEPAADADPAEAAGGSVVEAAAPAVTADEDDEPIPKARFDQERVRRLMAEAELQRMQEALQARAQAPAGSEAPALSIEELDRAAWNAAMEGDETQAAQLRAQMLQQMELRAAAAAEQAIERRAQAAELKQAAEEVRQRYPQLDADPALTQDVIVYRDYLYAHQGMSLADALRRAARTLAGLPNTTPPPAPLDARPDPAMERRRAAVQRAAEASRQQPVAAGAAGVGMRAQQSPARDVAGMSEEDFDALSPAEKSRMRGDAG